MRALGYPRIISMENFRRPNFELVVDILYWLALKYDPNAEISDNIDEEVSPWRNEASSRRVHQADHHALR